MDLIMKKALTNIVIGIVGIFALLLMIGATTPGIGPETDWVKFFKRDTDNADEARTNIFTGAVGLVGDVWTMTNVNGHGRYQSIAHKLNSTNGSAYGNFTFDGNVTINSNLTVTRDAFFNGSLQVPTNASVTTDVFGEIAADNNAWAASRGALQFYDGTANTFLIGALVSDAPSNGQVPTWNTGGTITWETISGSGIADGDKGDITVSGSGGTWTIDSDVVSNAKLRDSAGLSVIGRSANTTGDPADIAAANDGEVLRRSGAVIGFGTVATAGIGNDQVTYAKIQDISATQRALGRNTAGAGDTEEVTLSQLLDWIGSAAQGDILYRGASTWSRLAAGANGTFLQSQGAGANLQWATPAGSGDPILFNSTAVSDASGVSINDTAATATVPAVTWTLSTGASPDTAAATIGAASGTAAGVFTAQAQTLGGDKTWLGVQSWDSGLVRPIAKTASGTISGVGTNNWNIRTNASFSLVISGSPAHGQQLRFAVSNYAATEITMTNAAGIFWPSVGSNVTLFSIPRNSKSIFDFQWDTNDVAAGQWEIVNDAGAENSLAPGSGVTFDTNATTRVVTINASGDAAKVNETAVSDSFSLTNTPASATVAPTTWTVVAAADPDPDKVSVAIGAASASAAGIVTAQAQLLGGPKGFPDGVNVNSGLTANAMTLTNNITYVTANMTPSGNGTNFSGDYAFAWRTYLMTNAFRLTGMVNVAAADLGRAWMVKLRNVSGGALRVSVDAGFRRSGTNDVSVGNNQNADVLVTPDGTGGTNPTNHTVQIILYDSP